MAEIESSDPKQTEVHHRRRTAGRELAMKLLYVLDMRGEEDARRGQARLVAWEKEQKESEEFAAELFAGVSACLAEVDAQISKTADNWDLSRMAYVDRALLRLGTYELMYRHDIPPKVAISEAIELSKKYSTEKSSSFVNGILDRIFQSLNAPAGGGDRAPAEAEASGPKAGEPS